MSHRMRINKMTRIPRGTMVVPPMPCVSESLLSVGANIAAAPPDLTEDDAAN